MQSQLAEPDEFGLNMQANPRTLTTKMKENLFRLLQHHTNSFITSPEVLR